MIGHMIVLGNKLIIEPIITPVVPKPTLAAKKMDTGILSSVPIDTAIVLSFILAAPDKKVFQI